MARTRQKQLEYQTEYYKRNRDKIRKKEQERFRIRKYGISYQTYQAFVEIQQNKCAICKQPEQTKYKSLSVDHDHKTNMIRQLLCSKCNHALGLFRDDLNTLQSAIMYLERHKHESTSSS